MAINPENLFQNINPADTNYPFGSALNSSSPGVKDGTPITSDLVNDIWGVCQRLLQEAGLTPDGNPDTVQNSQYYDAFVSILESTILGTDVVTINNSGVITSPMGGVYREHDTETGQIIIKLPGTFDDSILGFRIKIMNDRTAEETFYFDVFGRVGIAAYNWDFYNVFACGNPLATNMNISLGRSGDDNRPVICIGNVDSSWVGLQCSIENVFVAGPAPAFSTWGSGWEISVGSPAVGTDYAETYTDININQKISQLQDQVNNNDLDIADLQGQINSNDGDILALQNAVSSNDTDIANLQNAISPGEWIAPSFVNGWTNGFCNLMYRLSPDGDKLEIYGQVDPSSATDILVFTLPSGYRISAGGNIKVPVMASSLNTPTIYMEVSPGGIVAIIRSDTAGVPDSYGNIHVAFSFPMGLT